MKCRLYCKVFFLCKLRFKKMFVVKRDVDLFNDIYYKLFNNDIEYIEYVCMNIFIFILFKYRCNVY